MWDHDPLAYFCCLCPSGIVYKGIDSNASVCKFDAFILNLQYQEVLHITASCIYLVPCLQSLTTGYMHTCNILSHDYLQVHRVEFLLRPLCK